MQTPLTPTAVNATLTAMGWGVSEDETAKLTKALNGYPSLEEALAGNRWPGIKGTRESDQLQSLILTYIDALKCEAEPVHAVETLLFEAGCADTRAKEYLATAVEYQTKADVRRAKGETSLADQFQAMATANLRCAAKEQALAKSKRENAARRQLVAA